MTKFWLALAIVMFVVVTYKIITENFVSWAPYYGMVFIALMMYFVKKWMMKRMEKHMEYMENQKKENK